MDNRQGVVAGQQLVLAMPGGRIDNRGGRIMGDRLDLQAASLDNSEGGLLAAGVDGARLILKQAAPGHSQLLNLRGRIQSEGGLQVESDAVDNSAGVLLGRNIDVSATRLTNNDKGGIVSSNGAVELKIVGVFSNVAGVVDAGEQRLLLDRFVELDNRGGTLRGKRLDISGTAIDNRNDGQILAGSDGLKITSASLKNQQGMILANGSHADLALGQSSLQNQGGTLQADSLKITTADLDNSALNGKAGLIASLLGNLELMVTRLSNHAGKLFAKDEVIFEGSSFDNAGGEVSGNRLDFEAVSQILNQGGLIESATDLNMISGQLNNSAGGQVRALGGASSLIKLSGDLINQNGAIEIGSRDLILSGAQLNSFTGSVRHAAQGVFDLDLNSLVGSQGSLTGLGSGIWEIGSVSGVGTWQLNGGLTYTSAQGLTLNAGERIASASALGLNVASLNNAGELLSDGNLSLALGANLLNSGRISAGQKLTIGAYDLIQRDGRLVSGGNTELSLRGTLDNLGRLIANQNLLVTAARIDNKGTLGAQGMLTFNATHGISNGADTLLFSGSSMELHSNSLSNYYGDIYSRGNLSFNAAGGGRAASFSNLSGTIEGEGDISINATSLENAKAEFEMTSGQSSGSLDWECGQHCGGGDGWKRGTITITTEFNDTVLKDSRAARFVAGKNMTISAGQVENRYSLMAANGNLDLTADNLLNQGAVSRSGHRLVKRGTPGRIDNSLWDQMEFIDVPAFNAATVAGNFDEARFQELISRSSDERFSLMSDVTTWNENGNNVYAAVLQAGGSVRLNVTHNIQNGTLYDNTYGQLTGSLDSDQTASVGGININLGKRSTDASAQAPKDIVRVERLDAAGVKQISFIPVDFRGVPFAAVDPTASSTFRLPQGLYGMFVQSRNPRSRYLIETNPELTQTAPFMSSDYLLRSLNFSADEAARRLGDGRYESRLISDAVIAQTGQRFLAAGLNDDSEQFRYLMDNALTSKNELNLSVGVTLTSEQVAALTHDIVWMEERTVDGQTVLVPVLYLAQAESRNVRGGSLIQGRDLTLIAGNDLVNVGTLRGTKDLSADVGGSLYQGGLVEANERLSLMATDSIRNALAGDIRGNQVSLTTLKGDIVNDRTAMAVAEGSGMRTLVDAGGSISARDTLSISSGRDLTNAAAISSGADASLSATRDINLLATRNASEIHESSDGGHRSTITTVVENLASSVTSGGNLSLEAGRDINVIASTAKAEGDLTAEAGRDLTLASAGDEHNVETHSKDGKKRIHEEDNHTVQKAAEFSAGGNVITTSGRDTALVASKISAGNEAYVYAGNNLNLLAAQNRDYTLYDMQEKGGFGAEKTQRDEVTQITHVGSEIKTGGNLTLVSEGDQRYQVAKLESGKDITLDSGGSITFEAVKDFHDESHIKSDNNAAWVSSKGKGNTDETLRQTQMVANGNIVIKAVDGLRIDIKDVDQQTVGQTIDAMVKADPQLAWLKEAEARGDVDWQLVKEIHESFKYENSGLGPASQLIIAIVMAAFVGPMALAAAGGTGVVAAGLSAVATGAATNATVSFINNGGNLGAVFQDVFSDDALKSYVISGLTAGLTAGYFSEWTGTTSDLTGKINVDLGTLKGVGQFAASQALQNGASAALGKILGQGGDFSEALRSTLLNTLAAASFNAVGDYTKDVFNDGSVQKIAFHAMVGGLLAEASGGDFRTGALAAGANEALVTQLNTLVQGNQNLLLMTSQIVGVLAAATQSGADTEGLQTGSWVTKNATQYNYLNHDQLAEAAKELRACKDATCRAETLSRYNELSFAQDLEAVAACAANKDSCASYSKEVANTMANLDDIYPLLGDGPTREWELIRESNLGFQEMLATFTAGHTSDAIAKAVQQKWGLSDEQTKVISDNLVLVAAGSVAAVAAKKALAAAFGAKATGQTGASAATDGNLVVDNGPKLLTYSPATKFFKGDEAVQHFGKHSSELMGAFGRSSYNLKKLSR